MSDLKCPHCYRATPYGAKVCTGCAAEVEYGMPRAMLWLSILVAVPLASWAGSHTHVAVGWTVFVGVVVGGLLLVQPLFRNRVVFKRLYRR